MSSIYTSILKMFSWKQNNIGEPRNLQHRTHIYKDPVTGDIEGVPDKWQQFLNSTNMQTGKDQRIDAAIEALEFHDNSTNQVITREIEEDFLEVERIVHEKNVRLNKKLDLRKSCYDVSQPGTSNISSWKSTPSLVHSEGFLQQKEIYNASLSSEQIYEELRNICNKDDPKKRFVRIQNLGDSGNTFVANDLKDNIKVAIKIVNLKDEAHRSLILNELNILKEYKHKNLVNFLGAYMQNHHIWITMELMDGGPLTRVITEVVMEEGQIAAVCRETLQGIEFLHSKGTIHRNIKSDNVLLTMDGSVKLTDFTFCANVLNNDTRSTIVGTPNWIAPEVASKKKYGKKIDIWSLGVVVIEMIDGVPPYMAEAPSQILSIIAAGGIPTISRDNTVSPELKDFLDRCLQVDEAQRATANELLRHPFLNTAMELKTLRPLIKATQTILEENTNNTD